MAPICDPEDQGTLEGEGLALGLVLELGERAARGLDHRVPRSVSRRSQAGNAAASG